MLARSLGGTSDSTDRSATSTPTSSPSPLHVDSFTLSTRPARSSSTECAGFHCTSVGCDTSAARRFGAWRSIPTATNAMSRAHSPTVPSTALPKGRSKWVPLTCGRDQAWFALGHGRSGLPNITLQRSGGLALLAHRPLSVRVPGIQLRERRRALGWSRCGEFSGQVHIAGSGRCSAVQEARAQGHPRWHRQAARRRATRGDAQPKEASSESDK